MMKIQVIALALLAGCAAADAEPAGVAGAGIDSKPCVAHGECPSGVCGVAQRLAGQRSCLRTEDVFYVDVDAPCGDGTMASPSCSFPWQRQRATIKLARERSPALLIVGSGTDWAVYAGGVLLPGVFVEGFSAKLMLEGARVLGRVKCSSGAVDLRGVEVAGSSYAGVSAVDCAVRIEDSLIRFNADGGVELRAGTFQIVGNTIEENRSAWEPAVQLASDAEFAWISDAESFRGNVVRGNKNSKGLPGGIYCSGRERALGPNAVCGNSGAEQVSNCTLSETLPCVVAP